MGHDTTIQHEASVRIESMPQYIYSNSLGEMVVESFYYKEKHYTWSDCDCVYYWDESDEDWLSDVPEGCSYSEGLIAALRKSRELMGKHKITEEDILDAREDLVRAWTIKAWTIPTNIYIDKPAGRMIDGGKRCGMKKNEFEALIGQSISDCDYRVIEKVYLFHPSINRTCGREEIAELYKSFGISIFCELFPKAMKMEQLENVLQIIKEDALQFRYAQEMSEQIKEEMEKLSSCSMPMVGRASTEVQEGHGLRAMFELMNETLTKYLRDPNITSACKRRVRHCLEKSIDDIYRQAFPEEDPPTGGRRKQHDDGGV